MTWAVIAYVAANVLDVVSTNMVLKRGGRELNPILRWAMDWLGPSWPLVKIVFAGAALALLLSYGAAWPIWALSAVFAVVALRNFKIVRRMT